MGKININQNLLYSASGALDPRFIVDSIDKIENISNAYVGLEVYVVNSENNIVGKYKIKKINNLTKKPLPANEGGYELIRDPKDLLYPDGTPFLNNSGYVNSDTKLIEISDKIDKLPTGIYYGQYSSEENLPEVSELDQKGYAYVASSNPTVYYIYLYNGTAWENSGNKFVTTELETNLSTKSQTKAPTTKAVKEGIEAVDVTLARSAEDENELTKAQKYNAASNINDRGAVSAEVEGVTELLRMGYKVLKDYDQNNPNTTTFQAQVTLPNTIYEIKDFYDLQGTSVTIPANSTLYFNGGLIKNGTVVLDNTEIKTNGTCFQSIILSGRLRNDYVNLSWWNVKRSYTIPSGETIVDINPTAQSIATNNTSILNEYVIPSMNSIGRELQINIPLWINNPLNPIQYFDINCISTITYVGPDNLNGAVITICGERRTHTISLSNLIRKGKEAYPDYYSGNSYVPSKAYEIRKNYPIIGVRVQSCANSTINLKHVSRFTTGVQFKGGKANSNPNTINYVSYLTVNLGNIQSNLNGVVLDFRGGWMTEFSVFKGRIWCEGTYAFSDNCTAITFISSGSDATSNMRFRDTCVEGSKVAFHIEGMVISNSSFENIRAENVVTLIKEVNVRINNSPAWITTYDNDLNTRRYNTIILKSNRSVYPNTKIINVPLSVIYSKPNSSNKVKKFAFKYCYIIASENKKRSFLEYSDISNSSYRATAYSKGLKFHQFFTPAILLRNDGETKLSAILSIFNNTNLTPYIYVHFLDQDYRAIYSTTTYNKVPLQEETPIFVENIYYKYEEDKYVKLIDQPDDWDTNYTDYYTATINSISYQSGWWSWNDSYYYFYRTTNTVNNAIEFSIPSDIYYIAISVSAGDLMQLSLYSNQTYLPKKDDKFKFPENPFGKFNHIYAIEYYNTTLKTSLKDSGTITVPGTSETSIYISSFKSGFTTVTNNIPIAEKVQLRGCVSGWGSAAYTGNEIKAILRFGFLKPNIINNYFALTELVEWEAGRYYRKIIQEDESIAYELLNGDKPDDWDTNYTGYYYKATIDDAISNGDAILVKIASISKSSSTLYYYGEIIDMPDKEVYTKLFFEAVEPEQSITTSKNKLFNYVLKKESWSFVDTLIGTTRPTLTSDEKGVQMYDLTLNKQILWEGSKWVDQNGHTPLISKGTSTQRLGLSLNNTNDIGFRFFDTTLGKPVYWNGTTWMDYNGKPVELQVSDTSILIGAAAGSKLVYVYYDGSITPTITVLNSDDSANTWLTATYTLYAPTFVTNTYYSAANTKVATKPSNWETNYMDYFTDAEATISVEGVPKNEVVLTADANNTSAPRGAKILVTLDDELVIINVVQSY